MSRYYRVSEVAERLSVAPRQVTDWIKSGQLLAIDVSRTGHGARARYRISHDDLDAFVRQRSAPAKASTKRQRRGRLKVIRFF
jgi:excisionase family DNA binding protein